MMTMMMTMMMMVMMMIIMTLYYYAHATRYLIEEDWRLRKDCAAAM